MLSNYGPEEDSFESILDSKEIKPVNSKGNQLWLFTGKTDAEAKDPVLWSPDVKSQLTGKDPDAVKHWGCEGKEATEDEMAWPTQMDMNLSKLNEMGKDKEDWHDAAHGSQKNWTQLSDWTITMYSLDI